MGRRLRRLSYRSVQRTSTATLKRRIENIKLQRDERVVELRSLEERYVGRLNERSATDIANEIDHDERLAQPDRDLLVNEIFAFDVLRKRGARTESREGKNSKKEFGYRPIMNPSIVRALDHDSFLRLGNELKDELDLMKSQFYSSYNPEYRQTSTRYQGPVEYYVERGISQDDFENLSSAWTTRGYSPRETTNLMNRISWGLVAKDRGLEWRKIL